MGGRKPYNEGLSEKTVFLGHSTLVQQSMACEICWLLHAQAMACRYPTYSVGQSLKNLLALVLIRLSEE